MPPVFRPVSPSPTRLWSCAPTNGTAIPPPTTAKKLASSPVRNSSTTIADPASPNALRTIMSSTASSAVCTSIATMTPLPAASPSVLTTIGAPCVVMYALAAAGSVKRAYLAVGMSYLASRSLRNPLDPSRRAAEAEGPKHGTPAAFRESASPSTRGASGPHTTSPTAFFSQKATTAAWSFSFTSTVCTPSSTTIPALPGQQKRSPHVGDSRSRQHSECSRPPPPTTSTLILSRSAAATTGLPPPTPAYTITSMRGLAVARECQRSGAAAARFS
mmetsp:Transcript_13285/g.32292  ORF Transcript_13285/g.32292 Transcript_13285/m.32292 type:complete len:274 (-) Transcript_13285:206-1027(-)